MVMGEKSIRFYGAKIGSLTKNHARNIILQSLIDFCNEDNFIILATKKGRLVGSLVSQQLQALAI